MSISFKIEQKEKHEMFIPFDITIRFDNLENVLEFLCLFTQTPELISEKFKCCDMPVMYKSILEYLMDKYGLEKEVKDWQSEVEEQKKRNAQSKNQVSERERRKDDLPYSSRTCSD